MEILGYDLQLIVGILIVIVGSYIGGIVVAKLLTRLFEKTPFSEDIEQGIVKASKYCVYFVGLLIIIAVVGFDITSIMIGLGAFSIAVSFALSNIIQNFVSGILIRNDRPFEVGDVITVMGDEGKVIKIGLRRTVLQSEDGNLVYVPNSIFAARAVINKTREEISTPNNSSEKK